MDALLSHHSIGISEVREAPAKVFALANEAPLVVLNHNRPAGYIVSADWMARVLDQVSDRMVTDKALARMDSLSTARRIDPADL